MGRENGMRVERRMVYNWVCVGMYVLCVYVYVWICACVYASLCMCICVYVYMCVSFHCVYMQYIYSVYICMCVGVYV